MDNQQKELSIAIDAQDIITRAMVETFFNCSLEEFDVINRVWFRLLLRKLEVIGVSRA